MRFPCCSLPYLDVTHSFLPRTSERTHAQVFSTSVPRLWLFILEREDVEPILVCDSGLIRLMELDCALIVFFDGPSVPIVYCSEVSC